MITYRMIDRTTPADCGHEHRTPAGAQRCADRHVRGCRRQGGYGTPVIVERTAADRAAGVPYVRAQPGCVIARGSEYRPPLTQEI